MHEEVKNNIEYINTIYHKNIALQQLEFLLDYHIDSNNFKKANLILYWLEDFAKYNLAEKEFDPSLLKRYKRGSVIKANLGFNIGNEEGGLHYCIVLDKANALSSGTLTVVPLTSIKENKKYNSSTINLGNEIYLNLSRIYKEIKSKEETEEFDKQLEYVKRMQKEIDKMKKGSIALISQITTISKQRIYNPKTSFDILANLRVSNDTLDLIDAKIKKLFLK